MIRRMFASATAFKTGTRRTHGALSDVLTVGLITNLLQKSFGKSRVATPHGREWTRPLRVLAVQCPLQTSPVTQPPVRYIHTTQTDTHPFPEQ